MVQTSIDSITTHCRKQQRVTEVQTSETISGRQRLIVESNDLPSIVHDLVNFDDAELQYINNTDEIRIELEIAPKQESNLHNIKTRCRNKQVVTHVRTYETQSGAQRLIIEANDTPSIIQNLVSNGDAYFRDISSTGTLTVEIEIYKEEAEEMR